MKDQFLRKKQIISFLLVFLLTNIIGLADAMAQVNTPIGAIKGLFSVNANGDQVYFSKGNLQYQASTNTWRFPENQWDCVGPDNEHASSTYDGWIDKFGWGTSGYNHGANCYQPWSTSHNSEDYYAYGNDSYNLYDSSGQADWGYNAISNGGNLENSGWRTMRSNEWGYIMNDRMVLSGIRFAKALVNDIGGVILFPDNWNADLYNVNNANDGVVSYNSNIISSDIWGTVFEANGAVFLPQYIDDTDAWYCTSSKAYSGQIWVCIFSDNSLDYYPTWHADRYYVRLVRNVQSVTSYSINAQPNPAEGGSVTGFGMYQQGQICTLSATANEGYIFTNWTENGEVVSANATYTFTVTGNRNLVANFTEVPSSDFIVFADDAVKAICVEHWDTNGDGELSYAEAAAVTALNDAFHGHPITSFDEFQYFIGVTAIEDLAFDYNDHLVSITLPNTITSIGYSFRNCKNLNSFYIPASITEIHKNAFESCRHMEQIVVAENNPVYDSREGCNAIIETASNNMIIACKNTFIPNTVTSVDNTAFIGKDITSLFIPSSVVSFGSLNLIWCPVEQIVVDENNPVFDSRENCNAIIETSTNKLVKGCKNTVIPNTVTKIGESAFIDCDGITSITIPAAVTYIGLWAFRIQGLNSMTIEATTPPQLYWYDAWHSPFGGVSLDIPVYVPCGTIETYQNADVWNRFTNFIESCSGDAPIGAINGKFTINNNGDQVYFSQGNLQYQASTNTWRFALNQWETVGLEDNENASATFDGWIDKYDWATSGYPHIEDCYQPWSSCGMHLAYGAESYNLYDESGQADWGYNAISNGGNVENSGWRTVKGNEWSYLFNHRTTLSGIRYAKATVNGEYGVILFPDDWNADWYAVNNYNESAASYNSNIISGDVWESVFEAHGAVLLPQSSGCSDIRYCSASKSYTGQIWILFFADTFLTPQVSTYVGKYAVRLVRPTQEVTSYQINAVPNPSSGGTITGAGAFYENATCTLTATAHLGFVFQNWTENGEVVSTDATYSFTVTGDRDLVANFIVQGEAPTGALPGLFSVGEDTQVYFSQGNLQYQASTNTWRFSENQWEIIGEDNTLINQTFEGWIDLFSWGTSGYDHGAVVYQPWILEMGGQFNHAAYGCDTCGLRSYNGRADWGYNPILNGGNQEHLWNTMTTQEWQYLLNTRNTASGMRYAKAVMNDINGLVVFPDDWNAELFLFNNVNSATVNYNTNVISLQDWTKVMEVHGAVFLPAAGRFHGGNGLMDVGTNGSYWTASAPYSYLKTLQYFTEDNVAPSSFYPHCRYAVRLVRFTNTVATCSIEATPNPSEGGVVTGAGNYYVGTTATLMASANNDYTFLYWTEDGMVVSTNATYTFAVTGNRTLVANFASQGGVPVGAVNSLFSINDNGDQVYFSQGNLQYQASTNTWRFAENQWDYVGNETYGTVYEDGDKCNNRLVSETYSGWIDLFGWATSGYDHGGVSYQPWSISQNNSDYYAYGSQTCNLSDQSGKADWGYNAISNGGNQEHLWRSMTNAEWRYLLNQRNTTSGVLYAKATVNEVGGVLLLPDDWKTSTYNLTNVNNEGASYSSNIITLNDWENILQNAGAIFLPTCWSRVGTEMDLSRKSWGMYWTGSYINSYMAYPISFSNSHLDPCSINGYDNRRNGQGVRLVCAAEAATTYSINAIPNPDEGGTITGAGTFALNTLCTLTATANSGYAFLYWTENGEVLSTNVTYTFTVTDNRTLTACFSETVDDDIIVFADENVKAICVANWDTDDDGELSYSEAAAVTDIGLAFSENGSITSFNEFQYFTGVTALEQYAFGWSSIASIVIPSSVTTLDAAFYAAGNLISITIPASVTSISSSAFSGCDGLEQIIVEEGNPVYDSRENCNAIIQTENNELIQGCMNTVIPNTVTAIGWNAFSLIGSLTSITIPESVISISYTSFYACSGLERIIVKPNNPVYDSRGNCNAIIEKGTNKLVAGSKNTVIPNTVTSIGSYAFSYRYDGQTCSLIIPSSVSVLESRAFMGCRSLASLTIPHTVVSIGDYCFDEGWNLESITVLATEPPVLGQNAFYEVNKDLVLTVPCNTAEAYQNAQGWNEFTNIQEDCNNMFVIDIVLNPVAGGTVTGAGTYRQNANCTVTATAALGYVFENWTVDGEEVSDEATYTFTVTGDCSLVANFTVTEGADFIVFADPATKAICVEHWDTNGDGELSYAEAAAVTEWHGEFDYASITSFDELQYFTGLRTVGFYITYYMTSVILPNTITHIGYYGFAWCNALTSIVIPNSVTSLHADAFVGCSNMTTVTIGNSVTEIRNEAFKDCTGLESIYVLAETPPILGTDVFLTVNMAIPVHVPCGTLEAYQNADGWSEFTNIHEDCTDQKNINITINPAAGGVVNGAGNYQVGTTATLSCMANSGYEFSSWMENGEVVSTDVTYSFTVTSDRSLVANFTETMTPGANHWIVDGSSFEDNMSFTAVIQINGVEQHSELLEVGAFCGEECRGSQLPQFFEPTQRHLVLLTIFGENGDMIHFRLYDHATVQELELTSPAPIEFNGDGYGTPTQPYVLNFTTASTQTQTLSYGWNWWCSGVELDGSNGLSQLENGLGANGIIIKSRNDGYVQPFNDNGQIYWFGTLDAIYNEQFYKVRTNDPCTVSINGLPVNPSDHPITINKGWNWIGFLGQHNVSLQTAFSGFDPEPDDVVKGRDGFASYFSENGYSMWYGTLNTLEAGQGYMYRSNANGTKTLTYTMGRGETTATNITPRNTINQPNSSDFADNMTMIAVVEMERKELRSSDFELVAFVGDECRGSVKLLFAPFINRYMAFLTVFGESSEQLHFRLTNGIETIPSDDTVSFLGDAALGTITDPVILHFNSTGVGNTVVSNVKVYPNPSTGVFLIEGEGIERIEVYNTMGQMVLVEIGHGDSVRIDIGDQASGIYLMRAITRSGLSNITIVKE